MPHERALFVYILHLTTVTDAVKPLGITYSRETAAVLADYIRHPTTVCSIFIRLSLVTVTFVRYRC